MLLARLIDENGISEIDRVQLAGPIAAQANEKKQMKKKINNMDKEILGDAVESFIFASFS